MNANTLERLLDAPVQCFDETASTNAAATAWAKAGAPHGALVAADRQTRGRGRHGRSYCSPEGGLYMSLILKGGVESIGGITTLAAVAVCRFAKRQGFDLKIKWVNDCMLDGKKVCGILAEGGLQQVPPFVVVGIGLNVGPMVLPEDLLGKAAALFERAPRLPMENIAAQIARDVLEGMKDMPGHMTEYRARCVTLGRRVRWMQDGETMEGTAKDVADDGSLVVETFGGTIGLSSGEVSIHMKDGSYA